MSIFAAKRRISLTRAVPERTEFIIYGVKSEGYRCTQFGEAPVTVFDISRLDQPDDSIVCESMNADPAAFAAEVISDDLPAVCMWVGIENRHGTVSPILHALRHFEQP